MEWIVKNRGEKKKSPSSGIFNEIKRCIHVDVHILIPFKNK